MMLLNGPDDPFSNIRFLTVIVTVSIASRMQNIMRMDTVHGKGHVTNFRILHTLTYLWND